MAQQAAAAGVRIVGVSLRCRCLWDEGRGRGRTRTCGTSMCVSRATRSHHCQVLLASDHRHGSRTTPHARRAAGGRAPGRPARERGARRPERDGPAAGLQLHAERSRGPRPRSAVPGARRAPPATTADRGAARAGRVRDRVHPGPGAARSARSLVIPFATRGARRNG